MVTDPRTGVRSIQAARETFAAVALIGLSVATLLRCIDGRSGGVVGAILTMMALATLSRYRVSWDQEGISCQTPFGHRRKLWAEFSAYSFEPDGDSGAARLPFPVLQPCRLRLSGRATEWAIDLKPYSWQDIRHLADRVHTELPQSENSPALVS